MDYINASKLPRTKARTAPSIIIKATKPEGGTPVTIGAVKGFRRTIARNMTRRYELDTDVPGITTEIIPGAVTDFTITIDRAMLNKSAMLKAFGITAAEDLIHQNVPITIEEHRFWYDEVAKTSKKQVVSYLGCYFKSNPMEINLDGDWLIIQSADLEVQTCVVSGDDI